MLARLARFSFRRRRLTVFGIWLPVLVGLNVLSSSVGSDYSGEFSLPDSESRRVQQVFTDLGSEEDAGLSAQIVFTAEQGVDDPAVVTAMTAFLDEVEQLDGVKVVSPYSADGALQTSPAEAEANTAGVDVSFAGLTVTRRTQAEFADLSEEIRQLGDAATIEGVTITYGGQVFYEFEQPESEFLGVLAAILILLVSFGSVIAMGLPIGTALFGLGIAMALVVLTSNLMGMPEVSPQLAAMIGLGVGIDYALFIVSRYREHLQVGEDPETAAVAAVDSSGRAVLFAGVTVMISLLGLLIMRLSFVQGLAVAGVLGVFVMMLASVTLLPALLGFAGGRIHTTSLAAASGVGVFVVCGVAGVFTHRLGAMLGIGLLGAVAIQLFSLLPFARRLRRPLPHRVERTHEQRAWYRWSRFVQRRPWPAFLLGSISLLVLAIPTLSIRLGTSDAGNQPESSTVRQAYDTIAAGFGPGTSGPLVLLSTDPQMDAAAAATVDAAVRTEIEAGTVSFATPGVEFAPGTWLWRLYPSSPPQDEATTELVHHLRDDVLPATGLQVDVGGWTATTIDFADYLGSRLPLLIGAVLVLSFLLLMMVFRSLLVPLKAVLMNLLSVGAAYGVVVAIFQWGWGMSLVGVDRAGPVEAWAPMMLFAIVFGLSMDYEVFLLSRMKEEYDRTGDNGTAVADGLAVTARVITAAALIMVCVFAAFILSDDRSLKLFGLGMAVAVFVDATVVRMVLVPATMELLGARNWWLPRWIDRILPRITVE